MKFAALITLLTLSSFAQEVKNPWIKKPIIGMTGAYMVIQNNTNKEVSLIRVEGEDAKHYEIHTHTKVDGVMKMRQIKELVINPKKSVELKPMSYHIMMLEIPKKKIKNLSGKMKLIFSNGKTIEITAPVKEL